ncbi:MAG: D-tyrosyl-tRNA(Tyr) deacylase [Candidatus Cloacimonadota bacterium]|nr:MAG: D-tyrosyl-tRNA(Tyr) deacylase [Candidatus Cloacimonadota bacterium]PIE78251.1 MAG: D-tyrosyl-tRNA(Tyr) deacylase [Candidatus Delongbacteria bacterium]
MRILLQRVKNGSVSIDGKIHSKIDKGLLLLVGITHTDTEEIADFLINKFVNLRIFEDENGKMNLSCKDIGGEILLVSQFTLYGDTSRGRRPGFERSAKPDFANNLFNYIVNETSKIAPTKSGVFGADMKVSLINDGPVTFMLEKD